MPSLRQILADHAPLLLIDAASARVQIGHFSGGGAARWRTEEDEAGVAVFRGIEALGVDLAAVRAFAFCHGPGALLGIRTVAMALRVWNVEAPRPCFAYASLALVAHALGRTDATIVADARRELWHAQTLGAPARCLPAAELSPPLFMPEGFRHWSALPDGVAPVPYRIEELFSRAEDADLFQPVAEPDALRREDPAYVTWTPSIHRRK